MAELITYQIQPQGSRNATRPALRITRNIMNNVLAMLSPRRTTFAPASRTCRVSSNGLLTATTSPRGSRPDILVSGREEGCGDCRYGFQTCKVLEFPKAAAIIRRNRQTSTARPSGIRRRPEERRAPNQHRSIAQRQFRLKVQSLDISVKAQKATPHRVEQLLLRQGRNRIAASLTRGTCRTIVVPVFPPTRTQRTRESSPFSSLRKSLASAREGGDVVPTVTSPASFRIAGIDTWGRADDSQLDCGYAKGLIHRRRVQPHRYIVVVA